MCNICVHKLYATFLGFDGISHGSYYFVRNSETPYYTRNIGILAFSIPNIPINQPIHYEFQKLI